MKSLRLAVVVALFSVAAPTFAQMNDGLYIAAAYLATFTDSTQFEIGPKPADDADFSALRKGTGTFDGGFLGLHVAAGYSIFDFRPEVEISYRQIPISDSEYESFTDQVGKKLSSDEVDALNKNTELTAGDLQILGFMANVWYDIATGTPVIPYVGVGVGAAHITVDATFESDGSTQVFPAASTLALVLGAGAGLGYEIIDELVVSLGYRLLGTTEGAVSWNQEGRGTDNILRGRTLHHGLELAIRYRAP